MTGRPRAGRVLGIVAIVIAAVAVVAAVLPSVRAAGLGGLGMLGGAIAMVLGIAALRIGSPREPAGIAGLALGAVAALVAAAMLVSGGVLVAPRASAPVASGTRTATPSPTPTPDFPTFAPTTTSGRGSTTIALPAGATTGLVTATFTGSGYFTIVGADASGASSEPLVGLYGSRYSGTTLFGAGATVTALQVRGDGRWSVTVAPVSAAPALGATASGTGDAVLRLDGAADAWAATASGAGLFSLTERTLTSGRLLVSQKGAYSGDVAIAAGSRLLVVAATGAWTLTRH